MRSSQQVSKLGDDHFVDSARETGIHAEAWDQERDPLVVPVVLAIDHIFTDREAVVVQVTPVTASYSATAASDKPVTQASTVQWAFDARTGEYLRARSFPASPGG